MIMNARQHIYVKIMQFAAVLCQCVGCQEQKRRASAAAREGEEIEGAKSQAKSREPHRLNLASQSKVDGLVTVVAAAKGQKRQRRRHRLRLRQRKSQQDGRQEKEKEIERERDSRSGRVPREMHLFLSNLQTKMCIKIYDEQQVEKGRWIKRQEENSLKKYSSK